MVFKGARVNGHVSIDTSLQRPRELSKEYARWAVNNFCGNCFHFRVVGKVSVPGARASINWRKPPVDGSIDSSHYPLTRRVFSCANVRRSGFRRIIHFYISIRI